jgi:hypothetical protein
MGDVGYFIACGSPSSSGAGWHVAHQKGGGGGGGGSLSSEVGYYGSLCGDAGGFCVAYIK